MYRTHRCNEIREAHIGQTVELAGWVDVIRDHGGVLFVDLRDENGITQIVISDNEEIQKQAEELVTETVIQVIGNVIERSSKNTKIPTGEIEIIVNELNVLNESEVPPFTIEDKTDGGDDIRMKYRYLDLRRPSVRQNLELRHKMCIAVRNYLSNQGICA